MSASAHGDTGAEGTGARGGSAPKNWLVRGGSAGSRPGASRSGKFIKAAKLLLTSIRTG